MAKKNNNKKIFTKEGVAIIIVGFICLLLVASMYIYIDKHLNPDSVSYEVLYESKEIPIFNKDKYVVESDN